MTETKERIALVTGASKGIGAAIARDLARNGFDIWLNYRSNTKAAEGVASEIEELGRTCKLLAFDVGSLEDTLKNLTPLLEEQTPEILVNNAGFTKDNIMFWMEPDEWHDVLNVHLNGFYNVTRPVVSSMIKERKGRIINIVSTSGQSGIPGQTNYSAAKAGLIGATKSLAKEVAPRKILVNAVSPGFIKTDITEELPEDKILPMIPLARMGTVDEVAKVVSFLCSDGAAYITGQVINVNGGIYM